MTFYARVQRYGAVGIAVSVLYSLAVMLLVDGAQIASATLASALAFAAILPLTYVVHRRVTFADAAVDSLAPLRFAVTTTASFLIATGGMYIATDVFGRSYLLGIALNWVLIPATNFLIYLVWVFRAAKLPADRVVGPNASSSTAK